MRCTRFGLLTLTLTVTLGLSAADLPQFQYLVLATSRTSTMQKEMNEAADKGYVFSHVMGGDTAFGGSEAVVVMMRDPTMEGLRTYRLLATNRTSTMQKELQQAGEQGFEYRGQTVFNSAFGGAEVCVILQRDRDSPARRIEYKLLATRKTSTMQKELQQAGAAGFQLKGMAVGETSFGGDEVVCILERRAE
ncbi:MAG: hypothetical protein GY953_09085 [bacterium]|nr:hypothetical protein [bacterium]